MDFLTWIAFLPLLGAIVIVLVPKSIEKAIRYIAVVATAIPLVLSVMMYFRFDQSLPGINSLSNMQFVERYEWIPIFNIDYSVGVDGLSYPMVFLTTLIAFLCIFASWRVIDKAIKGYYALFLLLETGMVGTFIALDFFLFYVFWELTLLPMYFLIGVWGGPRREYAAIKFFIYTLLGSVLMLLAILALYFTHEPRTFSMMELIGDNWKYGLTFQIWVFIAFFIAFAIKVPVFPFHTWLPDAHVEAPTPISVILAAVLLKMGTYAILRINFPLLPLATVYFALPLAILGAINIIYGALAAMAQKDLKKMVAYSSISHMGFVLLGIASFTTEGVIGGVLQMFNHGVVTAMLFLLVGVIYDRAHHRDIDGFGGLAVKMPIYAGITSLAFFAGLGLPGLNSFISEALVFLGAFSVYKIITIISGLGIVITAAYFLWTLQRVFFGQLNSQYRDLPEINGREIFTLVPLGILVIFLGVYPMPILNLINNSMVNLISIIKP